MGCEGLMRFFFLLNNSKITNNYNRRLGSRSITFEQNNERTIVSFDRGAVFLFICLKVFVVLFCIFLFSQLIEYSFLKEQLHLQSLEFTRRAGMQTRFEKREKITSLFNFGFSRFLTLCFV